MKNKTSKVCLVLIVSILIAIAPIYFFCAEYQNSSIYRDLSENVRYIDEVNIAVYQFPNRDSAQKASKMVSGLNQFTEITLMTNQSTLVQSYLCKSEPVIEYIENGSIDDRVKYRATITNGDINAFPTFTTYQLSPLLANLNLLNLIEGEMIDFNNKNEDCIEIMVTDGFGAKVNDEIYFTVNGLDENYKQVVVKAKVVGIVEKGSFLYGYSDYCGAVRTPESLHASIFENETIFTGDISYLYEYEKDPNSLLDEEIPVFLIGTKKGLNDTTIDTVIIANDGDKVILNANCVNIDNLKSELGFSYGILIGCIIAIILILFMDIFLIKKISKKDETCVISKH